MTISVHAQSGYNRLIHTFNYFLIQAGCTKGLQRCAVAKVNGSINMVLQQWQHSH